ncbi:hypothetical protein, partial [Symbiobacterium thermophilum]|uniref:hypothetical protein n=1 Tax=Symbiobacterium thermophilum TaxID=2734 RepID=UPI0035C771C2
IDQQVPLPVRDLECRVSQVPNLHTTASLTRMVWYGNLPAALPGRRKQGIHTQVWKEEYEYTLILQAQ